MDGQRRPRSVTPESAYRRSPGGFLPSVGGRLLSLRVDGRELLSVNPRIFDTTFKALLPRSAWPAVDGTFWPWTNVGGSKISLAPQGRGGDHQWPGPPDDLLDAGPWSSTTSINSKALVVTLVSPHDRHTGLCITRDFTFTANSPSFDQTIRFLNISDRIVHWSLWEVAQTNTSAGGGVNVPVSTNSARLDLGQYAGSVDIAVRDGTAGCRFHTVWRSSGSRTPQDASHGLGQRCIAPDGHPCDQWHVGDQRGDATACDADC